MPTFQSPIKATKPSDRDPLRNFKFKVEFLAGNNGVTGPSAPFATMGFMSVSGLGIQTDMIPYREGGDKTITRKMPGQSDVSPLTMVSGVFGGDAKNAQMEWMKNIFAVQWGGGNGQWDAEFRCDLIIRVMNHPITSFRRALPTTTPPRGRPSRCGTPGPVPSCSTTSTPVTTSSW